MTEWALPPESLRAFQQGAERLAALADAGELKRFFRAGGYWRNFKARYPESDEMYARMLGVSQPAGRGRGQPAGRPDYLEVARQELYRGQCNCPYWHGSFGGLYLPHLRNAIYRSLIAAHNALDDAEGRAGPRVAARGRRLQPRRPPGSPPRERPADRLGAARAGRACLRARRARTCRPTFWPRSIAAPRPTTRPSSKPPRSRPTARRARDGRRAADRADHFKQPGPRPAPGLRPPSAQGAGRSFLSHRRDPRRPDRRAATSSAAIS